MMARRAPLLELLWRVGAECVGIAALLAALGGLLHVAGRLLGG